MKISRAGDSALFVNTTGNEVLNHPERISGLMIEEIARMRIGGILECVASYTGFMVYFDPLVINFNDISRAIDSISIPSGATDEIHQQGLMVPVAYGGEYGPDINFVSEQNNLSPGEVALVHSMGCYTVHMLGFTPGFPYMGGMDKRLSTPRKPAPSLHIEAGSVGIAGDQTGIYPVESPGGWQIIGRTPLILFDPERDPIFLFQAGMKVQFRAIDNYEFWYICEKITQGEYELEIL